MAHIQNINEKEWTSIKWFVRGLIAGIKDTYSEPDVILEDYWHAWDNTLDLNIYTDTDNNKILCCAYAVKPDGYTDMTDFEPVYFTQTDEVLA